MKVTFKSIQIEAVKSESGVFFSNNNRSQHRESNQDVFEAFGEVKGNHNSFIDGFMGINRGNKRSQGANRKEEEGL